MGDARDVTEATIVRVSRGGGVPPAFIGSIGEYDEAHAAARPGVEIHRREKGDGAGK